MLCLAAGCDGSDGELRPQPEPPPPGPQEEMNAPLLPQEPLNGVMADAARHVGRAQMEGTPQSWNAAVTFLRAAIHDEPDNAGLHTMLGRLYLAQAVQAEVQATIQPPPAEGLEALERATELAPEDLDPRRALAEYLLLTGQPERAIAQLEFVLEREPEELYQIAKAGQARLAMGQLDEAEALFRQAEQRSRGSEDTRTWVRAVDGLGDVYRARGEPEALAQVIATFKDAQATGYVEPSSHAASCVFASLGDMYSATGSGSAAAESYAHAADVEPHTMGHQLEAARLLLEQDQPTRALVYLERSAGLSGQERWQDLSERTRAALKRRGDAALLQVPPDVDAALAQALSAFDASQVDRSRLQAERAARASQDEQPHVLLGFILMLEEKPHLARSYFEKAAGRAATLQGSQVGMAHLAVREKDYPGVLRLVADAAQPPVPPPHPSPDSTDVQAGYDWLVYRMACLAHAWRHSNQKEHDEAVSWYETVIQAHEGDLLARLGMANSLTALKRPAEATTHLERVLALDPDNQYALSGLALLHYNQGRAEDAEQLFQQALRQDGERYTCPYEGLGLVYLRQGRTAEAEEAFSKAIAINPDIEYLKYNGLARIKIEQGLTAEAEQLLRKSIENYPYDPEAQQMLDHLRSRR